MTYREVEILFWQSAYPNGYAPTKLITVNADGSVTRSETKPYEDLPEWVRNVIPKAERS